jgi:hypothetical protein
MMSALLNFRISVTPRARKISQLSSECGSLIAGMTGFGSFCYVVLSQVAMLFHG